MGSAPPHQLGRTLKRRHIALIGLGGVVGAGLFVGSSASINAVGPAVVLSYLAAGAIVYALMALLGELANAYRGIQAFPDLVRAAGGPALGFMIGWAYWSLWTIAIAIEALAGAGLLQNYIPLPTGALSALVVLVMMGINLLPTRTYGELEFWLSSVKVLAIILFVAIASVYGYGSAAARAQSWHHLTSQHGFMPYGVTSVLAGVVTVFFSLTGAELTTIAAAESSDAATNSRMAAMLIGRIVLFYVGSVFFIVSVVPWTAIRPGESPFTVALKAMGLAHAESIMAIIITTALLSCLNSAFYISSRVLFGLAANGHAPKYLVRLTSRRVPARSVMLGGMAAAVCLILAFVSPQTAFAFLVNATGTLILLVYLAVCVAYLMHIRRLGTPAQSEHFRRQRVMRCIAFGVMAVLLGVLGAMAVNPRMAVHLYVSAGAAAVCAGAYFLMRRYRGG